MAKLCSKECQVIKLEHCLKVFTSQNKTSNFIWIDIDKKTCVVNHFFPHTAFGISCYLQNLDHKIIINALPVFQWLMKC